MTTIHDHAISPLQKFVHSHQTKDNRNFQVSSILNAIICTFYSPEGTDPTSTLRLYTSDMTKLVQDLGPYGPHFDLAVRASIPSIAIWFFGDISKPNFILNAFTSLFGDRPIFASDPNLTQVFKNFVHNYLQVNTSQTKCQKADAFSVLFRREKLDIISSWLLLFKSKPFTLLFKSLTQFMTTQYYEKQSSLRPQVFGIKSL